MALGANEGDAARAMIAAAATLARLGGVTRRSRLYATDAVGGPPDQPEYRNAVVAWRPAEAWATPAGALAALLAIERALGRVRRERWGPRPIDLDLLAFVGAPREAPFPFAPPATELPHPRAHERAFVLVPWAEVAPHHRLPSGGVSIAEWALRVDRSGVRPAPAEEAARWDGAG